MKKYLKILWRELAFISIMALILVASLEFLWYYQSRVYVLEEGIKYVKRNHQKILNLPYFLERFNSAINTIEKSGLTLDVSSFNYKVVLEAETLNEGIEKLTSLYSSIGIFYIKDISIIKKGAIKYNRGSRGRVREEESQKQEVYFITIEGKRYVSSELMPL